MFLVLKGSLFGNLRNLLRFVYGRALKVAFPAEIPCSSHRGPRSHSPRGEWAGALPPLLTMSSLRGQPTFVLDAFLKGLDSVLEGTVLNLSTFFFVLFFLLEWGEVRNPRRVLQSATAAQPEP